MSDCMSSPVIYVDFDGVLHLLGEPALDEDFKLLPNTNLFCWRPILERVLAPYPSVKIIISSDWRRLFDDQALSSLLGDLAPRFLGAVEIFRSSRAEEIIEDAGRRGLTHWLAIDDHPSVVDASDRGDERFIACASDSGLSSPEVQAELEGKLRELVQAYDSEAGSEFLK